MAKNKTPIGAFIDLVGIRALAQKDPREYSRALEIFQTEVADNCLHLEGSDPEIRFFSDSAFLQCNDSRRLLEFLGILRYGLALHGVYFKGAVRLGDLQPKRASELPAVKDEETSERRSAILDGWYFGPEAVPTYGYQEALKGIGIWIVRDGLDEKAVDEFTVNSCYISPQGAGSPEPYLDLRLEQKYLTSGVLETFLNKFFVAKTESKRLGRFFVSFLVTWIQSIRFSEWRSSPPEEKDLVSILLDGGFIRMFGDVQGIEMVYYALLGSVWQQQEHLPAHLLNNVRGYVRSKSRLVRQIATAPTTILPRDVQEACLLELSSELMYGRAEEREAKERLEELLPQYERYTEVADKLNSEGILSPSGGVWYPQSVSALARKLRLRDTLGTAVADED